jgi:eukaryotic-like serine/threonine-protein kinase
MAEVFLGKVAGPKGFEKTLVLKRILPHLAEDQQFVELFLSEAKIAAQLNHPNIVQIYDFGEFGGAYYIAMEHVDGPNLRFILRRTIEKRTLLPIPLCVKIVSMACEGLAYAHEFCDPQTGAPLHLIHCDVSPENILLSRNGTVKVVDFGIAKAAGVSPQTKVGTFKGKVSYMPPERIQGNPIDLRADVFSLGVVLYELLTGVKPFNAKTEVSILHAILQEPIVPVLNRRPDVPDQLNRILLRSLAKDPDARYRSCREFQHELERFLVGIGKSVSSYHLARLVAYATDSVAANAGAKQQIPKNPPGIPPVVSSSASAPSAPQPEIRPMPTANREPEVSIVYDEMAGHEVAGSTLDLPRASRAPAYVAAIAMVLAGSVAVYALIQRQRIAGPAVKAPLPVTARTSAPRPSEAADPPAPAGTDAQPQPEDKSQQLTSIVSSSDTAPSPPPADAPPPEPSEPALERRSSASVRSGASFGVESRPRGLVRINGKLVGLSPVRIQNQSPGTVQVEVSNPEKAFLKQQTFQLNAGDNGTKVVLVEKGTLEFNIEPSATVLLDGKRLGETPLPPVQAYEGRHSIRLVNRDIKKEVSVDFTVKPGRTNIFKYNLSD